MNQRQAERRSGHRSSNRVTIDAERKFTEAQSKPKASSGRKRKRKNKRKGNSKPNQRRMDELFTVALAAKRAGRNFDFPTDTPEHEKRRVWARVYTVLRSDTANSSTQKADTGKSDRQIRNSAIDDYANKNKITYLDPAPERKDGKRIRPATLSDALDQVDWITPHWLRHLSRSQIEQQQADGKGWNKSPELESPHDHVHRT